MVAVPGDRLKVLEGSVYIDGKRQKESFARLDPECGICNLPREITIPKDHYFMMGDNRGESRGQPRVGAGAEEVDHRQGLHDLLASGPNRPTLGLQRVRFRRDPRL